MTTAEILRAALNAMNDNGAHWTKGEYADGPAYAPDTSYCSVGALNYVVTGDPEAGFSDERFRDALFALSAVLDPRTDLSDEQTSGWTEFDFACDRVITWNDDGERTWEEVVAKFTEAAEKAEV